MAVSETGAELRPPESGKRRWSRYRNPESLVRFVVFLLVLTVIWWGIEFLDVRTERFLQMFGRLGDLLATRYYPPDFEYVSRPTYLGYVVQTLQMAVLSALFGILIAGVLAWFAAHNVTPSPRVGYYASRLIITGTRAIHEMIWAIIFVTILGYGVLAGVLALTLFCVGFAGKLFAEEIEGIDGGQVEAVRATGANPLQVFVYGVFPQVKIGWTGITIYTWDVAFRAATVVGFFGAGGMGWYLRRTVDSLQSDRVAAIVITIILVVIVSEVLSGWARGRVMRG
jgi:phosphonate transport system permease protein